MIERSILTDNFTQGLHGVLWLIGWCLIEIGYDEGIHPLQWLVLDWARMVADQ